MEEYYEIAFCAISIFQLIAGIRNDYEQRRDLHFFLGNVIFFHELRLSLVWNLIQINKINKAIITSERFEQEIRNRDNKRLRIILLLAQRYLWNWNRIEMNQERRGFNAFNDHCPEVITLLRVQSIFKINYAISTFIFLGKYCLR